MVKSKEATVWSENPRQATAWELQLCDCTSGVIAADTVEIVTAVATVGFKLVLELHKSLDLVRTTDKSIDH